MQRVRPPTTSSSSSSTSSAPAAATQPPTEASGAAPPSAVRIEMIIGEFESTGQEGGGGWGGELGGGNDQSRNCLLCPNKMAALVLPRFEPESGK